MTSLDKYLNHQDDLPCCAFNNELAIRRVSYPFYREGTSFSDIDDMLPSVSYQNYVEGDSMRFKGCRGSSLHDGRTHSHCYYDDSMIIDPEQPEDCKNYIPEMTTTAAPMRYEGRSSFFSPQTTDEVWTHSATKQSRCCAISLGDEQSGMSEYCRSNKYMRRHRDEFPQLPHKNHRNELYDLPLRNAMMPMYHEDIVEQERTRTSAEETFSDSPTSYVIESEEAEANALMYESLKVLIDRMRRSENSRLELLEYLQMLQESSSEDNMLVDVDCFFDSLESSETLMEFSCKEFAEII